VLHRALMQQRVISFTSHITVRGRFWGLQRRWGVIWMVWPTLHASLNSPYVSFGLSFRPHRKSQIMLTQHVQVLLLPQGLPLACATLTEGEENCIWWDQAFISQTCWVNATQQGSSEVTREGIYVTTGESWGKQFFCNAVIFFSSWYLGMLESGKVWRVVNQVDCGIRSTIQRGWETRASRSSQLCLPIPIIT